MLMNIEDSHYQSLYTMCGLLEQMDELSEHCTKIRNLLNVWDLISLAESNRRDDHRYKKVFRIDLNTNFLGTHQITTSAKCGSSIYYLPPNEAYEQLGSLMMGKDNYSLIYNREDQFIELTYD